MEVSFFLGIVILLIKLVLVLVVLLLGAGWLTYIERRLLGWFQLRPGPNLFGRTQCM